MKEINQDIYLAEKYLSEGKLLELKKIYENNLENETIVEMYLTYLMENSQFEEVLQITSTSIRSSNIITIIRKAEAKIAKELLVSEKMEELEQYAIDNIANDKVWSICIKGYILKLNFKKAITMCEMYLENQDNDVIKSQYVTSLSRKKVKNSQEKQMLLQKALDVLNSIENKNEITTNQTVLILGKLGREVEAIQIVENIPSNENIYIYGCHIYASRGEVIEIQRIMKNTTFNKDYLNSLNKAKRNNKDIFESIKQDDSIENLLKLHEKYPSNINLKEKIVYYYLKINQIEEALMYIKNLENREYVMVAIYKKCIELDHLDIARQIAENSYKYCNNIFLNNRMYHYFLEDNDMMNLESNFELIQDNNRLVSIYIKKLMEFGDFEKVIEITKKYPDDMVIQSQAISANFSLRNINEAKLIYEQSKKDPFILNQGRQIYIIEEFGFSSVTTFIQNIILEEKYNKENKSNIQHLYEAIDNKDRTKILIVLMLLGKRKEIEEDFPEDYENLKQMHSKNNEIHDEKSER